MWNLIKTAVYLLLGFIQTALIIRAILSWLPIRQNNVLERVLAAITEPVLYPFRWFWDRTGIYSRYNIPIDLSFVAAFFVLWLIMPIFM